MKSKIFIKSVIATIFMLITSKSFAQIKIGDNLGNHKATRTLDMNNQEIRNASGAVIGAATFTNTSVSFELAATDKAILFNRVAALTAINTPINGMAVFNNADSKFYVYQGGRWVTFGETGEFIKNLSAANVGNAPNATGITLSASQGDITITLQPADATNPGVLTAGAQVIGGDKSLTGATTLASLTVGGNVIFQGIGTSNNANDVVLVIDELGNVKKSTLLAGSINKLMVAVPVGSSALFTTDNVMVEITLSVPGIKLNDGVVVNILTADLAAFTGLSIMNAVASADNVVKVTIADIRNPADPSFAPVAIDAKNFVVTYLHK